MNSAFLEKLVADVRRRFPAYMNKALMQSAEHGVYGMQILETLQSELSGTTCDNCGVCCNSISIYSLEYHRIVRDMLVRFSPKRLREIFSEVFAFDRRLAEVNDENRLRCAFRDDSAKVCLIHPVRPFACRLFGMTKKHGDPECPKVRMLTNSIPLTPEYIEKLQTRVMENSESFQVFPGRDEIAFFPFEFWVFRYTLGAAKALELYREVLIPASTPLTNLWKTQEK